MNILLDPHECLFSQTKPFNDKLNKYFDHQATIFKDRWIFYFKMVHISHSFKPDFKN